jgi:hypothetical protein
LSKTEQFLFRDSLKLLAGAPTNGGIGDSLLWRVVREGYLFTIANGTAIPCTSTKTQQAAPFLGAVKEPADSS